MLSVMGVNGGWLLMWSGEQGPSYLGRHGIAALLAEIHKVEDSRPEMGNRGDGLHLDGVHLLEGVVEDSGRINGTEPKVRVVKVPHKQALGGEGIRLHVDIRARDALQERRLARVGEAADDKSPRVGVDGRETAEMLADLVQVQQGLLELLDEGGHAAEAGALQLLALEERLGVLNEADVVAGDGLGEVLGGAQLAEGDAELRWSVGAGPRGGISGYGEGDVHGRHHRGC